jgi:hypothetical protein
MLVACRLAGLSALEATMRTRRAPANLGREFKPRWTLQPPNPGGEGSICRLWLAMGPLMSRFRASGSPSGRLLWVGCFEHQPPHPLRAATVDRGEAHLQYLPQVPNGVSPCPAKPCPTT